MKAENSEQFRQYVTEQLAFTPETRENCCCYKNPANSSAGYLVLFEKKGCYEFEIADYTVPRSFRLTFHSSCLTLRFGIFYEGMAKVKLDEKPVISCLPSPFLMLERELSGQRVWKRGQYFRGISITVYKPYFDGILRSVTGFNLEKLGIAENQMYRFLPLPVIQILQQMQALSERDELNPIYLESKIMECLGVFYNEACGKKNHFVQANETYEKIKLGSGQTLQLSKTDRKAIQKAHEILSSQFADPPTIESLSRMVFLNTQKLKAGFSHYYHTGIREFIISLRMSEASVLLCTTDMHIRTVGQKVGYSYPGNFIKMFRQHYGITPLQYRAQNRKG